MKGFHMEGFTSQALVRDTSCETGALRAIWGNTLPSVKEAWKSVEKLTSEAFVGMWRERVAHFQSKYMGTATADAARAK
jgi:hypothetical protein